VIYLSTFKDDRGSFDSQSKSYYYELSFYAVWVFRDCLKTIQQLEVQHLKFRNITFFRTEYNFSLIITYHPIIAEHNTPTSMSIGKIRGWESGNTPLKVITYTCHVFQKRGYTFRIIEQILDCLLGFLKTLPYKGQILIYKELPTFQMIGQYLLKPLVNFLPQRKQRIDLYTL